MFTPEEKEKRAKEMHAFYMEGNTLEETGRKFRCSAARLARLFRSYGLPKRKVTRQTPEDRARQRKAIEMRESGATFAAIGEALGVSVQRAHKLCGRVE